MPDFKEGDFNAGRVKIHYYRTGGNKPKIVLLHGATDNGLCWTPVARALARRYDVIMPDAQGHGRSDRLGPDFTSADLADQVIALVERLGITGPVITGHSMGAGTAVDVAVKRPHLPKAIILEDPAWRSPEAIKVENSEAGKKQWEAMVQMLTGYNRRSREELIAECRGMNPRWPEAEILPWAEAKTQFDPSLFSRLIISQRLYTELVPQIRCPILLVTSDGGIVAEETARQAEKLWTSEKPFRRVKIDGAGHNIHREQPRAFLDAVTHFLGEISG